MKLRSFILAIFFLCCPARADAEGKSNFFKTPPCSGVPAIALKERDIQFRLMFAPHILFKPRMKPKCHMPGRVYFQGGCWRPDRIKLMHKGGNP